MLDKKARTECPHKTGRPWANFTCPQLALSVGFAVCGLMSQNTVFAPYVCLSFVATGDIHTPIRQE